jgi:general secretion pathway protein K
MRRDESKGFVLVSVLWVLAILTVVTVGFGRRSMLDLRTATYSMDHTQALNRARGAVYRGLAEIQNKGVIDSYLEQEGYTARNQRWAGGFDLLGEGGFTRQEGFEADETTWEAVDEESRINVNAASDELLRNAGLGMDIIRRIRSQIAPEDDEPGRRFQSIEELRFIRGVDDEAWFGTAGKPGIVDLFTVYGDGRVNVNTASEEVLATIPGVSAAIARTIVEYRGDGENVFETLDDVSSKAGVSRASLDQLHAHCKVSSGFFTITGKATERGGAIVAYAHATVDSGGRILRWWEEPLGW